jgi:hypothetical protein
MKAAERLELAAPTEMAALAARLERGAGTLWRM